jgi:hypothetical protein
MSLRYIMLQLFCIYSLCYMQCYFVREICFVLLHQHFPQCVCVCVCVCVCAVPNMAVSCISLILCFPGMLLRYCPSNFHLPLLLPVSVVLSHSTCTEFLLWGPYILKASQLLIRSHFCLQQLQHLLIYRLRHKSANTRARCVRQAFRGIKGC